MEEAVQFHLVYLTGPPASGKSTVAKLLERSVQPLHVFSYSTLLNEYVNARDEADTTIDDLRRESARRIRPEDVAAVDQILIERVNRLRHTTHIVVDSHPVTKEHYGFRVTAFSVPLLQALAPTMICMLYTDPQVALDRMATDTQGRQPESMFEADLHRTTQVGVALIYGITLGVPIYLLDSNRPPIDVVGEIARRLQAKNPRTSYKP